MDSIYSSPVLYVDEKNKGDEMKGLDNALDPPVRTPTFITEVNRMAMPCSTY
jgi:hypothetical protein